MSRVDCVMVLLAVIAHSDVLKLWCCGGVLLGWCGGRLQDLGRPNPQTVSLLDSSF
jgi:hypothetical protein